MDIKALITKHEGVRYKMYKDSLGIPTIGVGFNLTRPDAKDIITNLIKKDYNLVLQGKLALTPMEVDILLQKDLDECEKGLRKIFSDYDKLPEKAKAVLMDLRFNLGQKGLLGFPHTLEDFKKGEYKSAAQRLAQSKWATQVGIRAKEDIQLLNEIN